MSAPPADVASSATAREPSSASAAKQRLRQRSLRELAEERQRALFGMRAARLAGVSMTLTGLLLLFVASGTRGGEGLEGVVVRALGWLSWVVGGLAALSATRDLRALDERDGVAALAWERGFSERALSLARTAASVRTITKLVAVPALVLCLAALVLSSSLRLLLPRLLLVIGVVGYVTALGLTLGILARWAAAVSPRRGRTLLVALVLGPELARVVWSELPSIPSAFAWLLERLIVMGGSAT